MTKKTPTLGESARKAAYMKKYRDKYRNKHNRDVRLLELVTAVPKHLCKDVCTIKKIVEPYIYTDYTPKQMVEDLKNKGVLDATNIGT